MTDPFPPLARRDQAGSRGASLDSRTVPPTLPRFPVKRTALIAHLMEARHRSCVVLQGPAGSGKSTVVAVWAQALRPVGFESAWLTLSRRDNDVSHLFDGLLATLAQLNPAMGAEENLLAGQESVSDELDFLAVLLVRAVTEFRREVLLVLDDFHLISDARAIELLQWLLDYAPANLHLVLCSRNANPLSMA